MKFNFKIQQYQTDAVDAVVNVFKGQGYHDNISYTRDLGTAGQNTVSHSQAWTGNGNINDDETGYKNELIYLSDERLLENIRKQQAKNGIMLSSRLITDLTDDTKKKTKKSKQSTNPEENFGKVCLDVEMETGTGKTYVYIKTIFELNKQYGWSKFVVVVPSIAIREGVKKTFEYTKEHFYIHYSKTANFFIYNSNNLSEIDHFSTSPEIQVMIINAQAFASDFNESKASNNRNTSANKIFRVDENMQSRRPIDVISANRPIIIRDEPQKLSGDKTLDGLKKFKPLFCINYSATHSKENNKVYALDALDAFNQKLVKKIEPIGFKLINLRGIESYMYLSIIEQKGRNISAGIEIEVAYKHSSPKRIMKKLDIGDSLFEASNGMEQYKNYIISDINPGEESVTFTNGKVIKIGEIYGDSTETELRRIQIHETIRSHFEKEEYLFNKGIKTLSLFFIDEVAKYRQYDENGNVQPGEYAKMFEEEYIKILNTYRTLENTPYQKYLQEQCSEPHIVHNGYFSIDKKTGNSIDSIVNKQEGISADISAYDLILKDKERLLSFEEPTRFIFSHSALREGWDNPNVFQICALKHSDNTTSIRQEVGRGLRLCVNQQGNRMDSQTCGSDFHAINKLSVIASESYETFVDKLQTEIKDSLHERAIKFDKAYFIGKMISNDQTKIVIDDDMANQIDVYLLQNKYTDSQRYLTDEYTLAAEQQTFAEMPEYLQPIANDIHLLIKASWDEQLNQYLDNITEKGNAPKISNKLNANFDKPEFQALWQTINHHFDYTANINTDELIKNAIEEINSSLNVSPLVYEITTGSQQDNLSSEEIATGEFFGNIKSNTHTMDYSSDTNLEYDLIGKIAQGAVITRATAATILQNIEIPKQEMYRKNPEEFISKVIKIIHSKKVDLMKVTIEYHILNERYGKEIFDCNPTNRSSDKIIDAQKHIQDLIFIDSNGKDSSEYKFAKKLEEVGDVCVYAKLPDQYKIPTPDGNYTPDWAIVLDNSNNTFKEIYFVAETKGSTDKNELRGHENTKITCARKLFDGKLLPGVKYDVVEKYDDIRNKLIKQ